MLLCLHILTIASAEAFRDELHSTFMNYNHELHNLTPASPNEDSMSADIDWQAISKERSHRFRRPHAHMKSNNIHGIHGYGHNHQRPARVGSGRRTHRRDNVEERNRKAFKYANTSIPYSDEHLKDDPTRKVSIKRKRHPIDFEEPYQDTTPPVMVRGPNIFQRFVHHQRNQFKAGNDRFRHMTRNLPSISRLRISRLNVKDDRTFIQKIIDFILGKKYVPRTTRRTRSTTTTLSPYRGWLRTRLGHIPTNAFEAGRTLKERKLMYVVRAKDVGDRKGVVPGEILWGDSYAYMAVRGQVRYRMTYDLLIGDQSEYRWISNRVGQKKILSHSDVVIGGWEDYISHTLYVCRGKYDGDFHIGKMDRHGVCWVPLAHNGREAKAHDVEVLLKQYRPSYDLRYRPGFPLQQ